MLETSPLYAARPQIYLDNRSDAELTANLLGMKVEESTGGLYSCELLFNNWGPKRGQAGYLFLDRQKIDFGKRISVLAGNKEARGTLFKGRVMAIEARYPEDNPPQIRVLAEDLLQDLRMTRRTRVFENASDRTIMEGIARDYSLTSTIDVEGPDYPVITQLNMSDLAFLRERARAIDAQVWIDDNMLYVQARAKRNTTRVKFVYRERLLSVDIRADLANQRTSLVMGGWDFNAREEIRVEADEAAIRSELQGNSGGSKILEQSLGKRIEYLVHKAPANSKEARYLAEGHFRSMARRFLTGSGLAEGDARIRVGTRLELEGTGKMFDGEYFVTDVSHYFDQANGYKTKFFIERPWIGNTES